MKEVKTVPVLIKNPCPNEAYSVGKVYDVVPAEAKRLKDGEIAVNPPREEKVADPAEA